MWGGARPGGARLAGRGPAGGRVRVEYSLDEGLTQEVFDILRDLGFQNFQGYYFGRPVPVAELVSPPVEEVLS